MTTLLRGTMLAPGVSANRRLYTPELIQRAYDKLSERIKSGDMPVTMMTHHEAGGNSKEIVGRVTAVTLGDDGKLNYTAELADTTEAATIGKLVAPKDGKQFLRGVSIRGWWCGEPKTVTHEGASVTTADDMEVDGLDFTKTPGVSGAFAVMADATASEAHVPVYAIIQESVETRAEFTEAVKTKPYGSVRYADPGYQDDKVRRFPLGNEAQTLAAWGRITRETNSYTPAQNKRIRARIKGTLQNFGVNMTEASIPEVLTPANTTLTECYDCVDSSGRAGFSISAYNGPLTVSVSAYNGVDPADLSDVAMAAMQAACDAIHALDPDDDGDIDTGASEQTPDDNQMETAPASETVKESDMGDTTETPAAPAEETSTEETPAEEASPETTPDENPASDPPAAEADPEESITITRAVLEETVAKAVSAALNPRQDAETVKAATEAAEKAKTDELRESIRQEVIAEAQKSGSITRKGLVESATDLPNKPLHEMSDDELRAVAEKNSSYFFAHNQ